jgi:hypothetical protein
MNDALFALSFAGAARQREVESGATAMIRHRVKAAS